MASPTYQIEVIYTPQITSTSADSPFVCHRICYWKDPGGPVCCFEDNTDSYAGTPKTFIITIGDDPCFPHVEGISNPLIINSYSGYVQPCCDNKGTLIAPWSVSFIPD